MYGITAAHAVALQMLPMCVSLQCPGDSNNADDESFCGCEGTCCYCVYNVMTYMLTSVYTYTSTQYAVANAEITLASGHFACRKWYFQWKYSQDAFGCP